MCASGDSYYISSSCLIFRALSIIKIPNIIKNYVYPESWLFFRALKAIKSRKYSEHLWGMGKMTDGWDLPSLLLNANIHGYRKMDAQLTINYSQKEPSSALGLTIVKLCLSLSLSISQSLNLSLSLRDRDRADNIITLHHHTIHPQTAFWTLRGDL